MLIKLQVITKDRGSDSEQKWVKDLKRGLGWMLYNEKLEMGLDVKMKCYIRVYNIRLRLGIWDIAVCSSEEEDKDKGQYKICSEIKVGECVQDNVKKCFSNKVRNTLRSDFVVLSSLLSEVKLSFKLEFKFLSYRRGYP